MLMAAKKVKAARCQVIGARQDTTLYLQHCGSCQSSWQCAYKKSAEASRYTRGLRVVN